jgi:hypothetical protein
MRISQNPIRAVCVIVFLFITTVEGGQVEQPSLSEMISQSDTILIGVCASASSRWDPASRMILTDSVIKVSTYVRGQGKATIAVTTPGGVLRDRNLMMTFPGMATFVPGEEVMLLLSTQRSTTQVYGAVMGAAPVQQVHRMIQSGEYR